MSMDSDSMDSMDSMDNEKNGNREKTTAAFGVVVLPVFFLPQWWTVGRWFQVHEKDDQLTKQNKVHDIDIV